MDEELNNEIPTETPTEAPTEAPELPPVEPFVAAMLNEDNVVVNLIMVTSLEVFPNLVEARDGAIGDTWDGGLEMFIKPPPAPPVVPQSVTMRQARLALLGAGLLPTVEVAIEALPEPTRSAAKIEWDFSSVVERDRALVKVLGPALGLSEQQLDNLFIEAAKL